MSNKKKVFLVTGAAGFIGSHMVDFLLKKNFSVIGLDNLKNGKPKTLRRLRKARRPSPYSSLQERERQSPVFIKKRSLNSF